MDFAKVLLTVVGAFALTTYGLSRATQDLDFAVPRRTLRELADLQHILTLPGIEINEIRGNFERYGLEIEI